MLLRKNLPGIQDAERIERVLHALHERDRLARESEVQVLRFGEPDAVFAADDAVERDDAAEQLPFGLMRAPHRVRIRAIHHEIHVNVAVADVAERRNRHSVLDLQRRHEIEELGNAALRNDDVVVDLP